MSYGFFFFKKKNKKKNSGFWDFSIFYWEFSDSNGGFSFSKKLCAFRDKLKFE
jgi:hypothetical protein